MLKKARLYYDTIKYLKFIQIFGRIWLYLHKTRPNLTPAPIQRAVTGKWTRPALCSDKIVGKCSFNFLNETHSFASKSIWNDPELSKLWLYNLHYFDDLNAENFSDRVCLHKKLIYRWIKENPAGTGNGWEPYPISLRIVNWIKWSFSGNDIDASISHSLAIQARYLSKTLEWHLLGNHLFANAKALIYVGLFFEGREANTWLKKGLKIIERQIPEQVLLDGGNFELSPMYHAIFVADLLDILNILNTYKLEVPNVVLEALPKMMSWLNYMCHPDGEISFFNDATLDIAPSESVLQKYASRLNVKCKIESSDVVLLKESGYVRLSNDKAVLIADTANIGPDYLPGHAHADTLSFELSLFSHRVFVNSGISVYGAGIERQQQRGTRSHNSLVIDCENSSEIWGGFRVARRARITERHIEKDQNTLNLFACHDGYHRIHGKPMHCRSWSLLDDKLIIEDTVSGKGEHEIELFLHFHPNIKINKINENTLHFSILEQNVYVYYEGNGEMLVEPSRYHPQFGMSIENKKITIKTKLVLPYKSKIIVSWNASVDKGIEY